MPLPGWAGWRFIRRTPPPKNADLSFDLVVLVLEGKARAGVPEGETAGVTTVHAPGSGDDEIVARCRHYTELGDDVTVASADHGLFSRLAPLGVMALGPRTLRAKLASEIQ